MLAFGGTLKENPALPGFFTPAFRAGQGQWIGRCLLKTR